MQKDPLAPTDTFVHRHIGPRPRHSDKMLRLIGYDSLEALMDATVPAVIRTGRPLDLGHRRGEHELIEQVRRTAAKNEIYRSYIGLGYHGTIVPPVIQRNVLENPGWYTQYTPYQAEISQGRLEACFNFQTMVADLTGLPVANSSLLDEGTAAAEAMTLCHATARGKRASFFVSADCLPQTIAVVRTRAAALGIEIAVGDAATADFSGAAFSGVLLQYPTSDGRVIDYAEVAERAHASRTLVVVAADILSLVLLRPPGEFGADIAVGSTQRFGVPMGYGGPHAAYMATTDAHKRKMPGRVVGLSKDSKGRPALRLALQTREQHIRREKATSNICTAQVLLAVMAGMYAVYHGPERLRAIARRVHASTCILAEGVRRLGCTLPDAPFFDTLRVGLGERSAEDVLAAARARRINLRALDAHTVGVALDETVTETDLADLLAVFAGDAQPPAVADLAAAVEPVLPEGFARTSDFLTHPIFHACHSETEMLRYLQKLQGRDLSLAHSMISLGSCTMKLTGTSEMLPVTWPEFGALHPFAPVEQAAGYTEMFRDLEAKLCEITGFHAMSFQPNAGSQGEYTGLLVIRRYHEERGEGHRDVCLIPSSAHGTNPASAVMAGMRVVVVRCDDRGNIDVDDLRAKASQHADALAALMVTYPSTHGVFEESIRTVCDVVHENGGQVYMDGANLNALVGLCRPGEFGADVCHLNLHKTFCIPHGGGGPGMGPIGVMEHLAPFLPTHPLVETGGERGVGAIAAAPWGSPSILPISYVYILLMGATGLLRATQVAILNANYMAKRLEEHYDVLYRGESGRVAHEFILDFRDFQKTAHVTVEDVAKRLMDYGFHAPTMSWPVAGTLMIEPTESEPQAELDRFCDALIAIRAEIRDIEEGRVDYEDSALRHAPHTSADIASDEWSHPYSRETAAFPAPWVGEAKFWPPVGRVDNVWGDRNLVCTCPPVSDYE
jgi:glycine dehydrogenase